MIMSKARIPKKSYQVGETELRRGPWTLEEDNLLSQYITSHGEGRWNFLAQSSGLKRTGKSCRLRWLNYLKPNIRRGNLTIQEQLLILELHSELGNKWSKIAQHLPGRTDNEIKNYWRTRVQKPARHLKVDSNSNKLVQAVREFLMPRLKEKMEQNSSLAPVSSCCASSMVPTMETQKTYAGSSSVFDNDVPLHSPCPNPCDIGGCNDGSTIHGYCMQELEYAQNMSVSGCHLVNYDWLREDMGESFWSNDGLWQFKNIA